MVPAKKSAAPVFFISFILFAGLHPVNTFSQVTPTVPVKDTVPQPAGDEDKVFEKVEIEASYAGGDDAWRRFLEQNLNAGIPAYKGAPAGAYTVVIQFVVDKEGKISDIKALTSHGYGMKAEVIRVLRKAPRWNPAIQEGRPVNAYRKQPVTFMVTVEEKKKKKKNK
ncbi:MAG: TonB family protein [Bacteroidota bacterium]